MKALTNELRPCPFCGSDKLKVDKKNGKVGYTGLDYRVENKIYSVRCNKCFARGSTVSGKVVSAPPDRQPSWAVTDTQLMKEAIELWNGRS